MPSPTTIVSLRQPETIAHPLTAVLRSGARRLLAQAIEAEAEAFLAEMKGERLLSGRERVVRHGRGAAGQAARLCCWRGWRRPYSFYHRIRFTTVFVLPGCQVPKRR